MADKKKSRLYHFFVNLYADHNSTEQISKTVDRLIENAKNENGKIVNVGSGNIKLDEKIINVDICDGANVDYVANAEELPFLDASIGLIINQEVLEHTKNPFQIIKEFKRVLKPEGLLYCQVPFILGYHPSPEDYWRFTESGLRLMLEREGLKIKEIKRSVGSGTGFYRIAVEFFAISISTVHKRLYLYSKGFFSLLFYPIKLLDKFLENSKYHSKISGGYYIIAEK
jgi:SAM-dependent methyltransferase